MTLTVKRKRVTVDLILDQAKAEQIADLGRQLTQAEASHVTEGVNATARRIAKDITKLKQEVKGDTITLTLEALPLSQWRQVLEANTTVDAKGTPTQRIEDICADALKLMVKDSKPATPVEDIAAVVPELSDGQISPIWYTIRDLNAKLIDPKDTLARASQITRS